MKKTVWTFGLIAGVILSAMMQLNMLLVNPFRDDASYDRGIVIGYTTMVLAFLLVYFGVRSYRDNAAGGSVGFGRALAVGSLIVLIASLCYVATWEVVYFKLAPGYATEMQEYMVRKTRAEGGSPEEVEREVAKVERFAEMYRNPAFNAAVTFLEPLPVGLVFALVTAGVLSRRRRAAPAGLTAEVA